MPPNAFTSLQIFIIKMEFFEQSLMTQMIINYDFKRSQRFNKDPACITFLIDYIKKQITHINTNNLCLMEKLIQHYKFPILICFEEVYETIDDSQISTYRQELVKILCLVRKFTLEIEFQQLKFYCFEGKVKSIQSIQNKLPRNFNECDKNFLKYAHKISQIINKMRNIYKVTKSRKERGESTILRLDSVQDQIKKIKKQLHMSIQETNFNYEGIMVLQNNYIKIMKQKFEEYENKIFINLELISIEYSRLDYFSMEDYQERKPTEDQYEDMKYYQYCHNSNSKFQYLFSLQNNSNSQQHQNVKKQQNHFQLKQPLCCKQFFEYGQYIFQGDFLSTSCINLKIQQIYNKQTARIIKQEVCSLLNTKGGVALIGTNRNPVNSYQFIQGLTISQYQKQDIYLYLVELSKQIQPCIDPSQSYQIDFVPVNREVETYTKFACEPSGIRYQQSLYVIRIRIKYGNRNQIYSFRHDHKDFFFRRNKQGSQQIKIRDVLQIAKKMLVKSLKIPKPIHQGQCKQPFQGHPTSVKTQKPTNYNTTKNVDENLAIKKKGYKKNKKWKNDQKVNLPYQLTVFGVAYDYLIWGLTGKQVWKIFYWKNIDKLVGIREVGQNVTYVRNLYKQNIKNIKLVIKQLDGNLGQQVKRVKVTAISKNIILNGINISQIDEVYRVLIDLGFRFYSYEDSKDIVRFQQTYDAGIAFIQLTKLDYTCQFVVNQ